jgi:hypothetical protein
MKQVFHFIALVFLLAVPVAAYGQNPVTSDNVAHFSLTANATGFLGGSGGSQPATIEGAWMNISRRVSLGYLNLTIPTLATFHFGAGQYQAPLSSLLGKKITAHLLFDASKVSVGFQGGVGKLVQGTMNVSHIAEIAGVCLNYPVSSSLSMQLVCGYAVHGGVKGFNGFVSNATQAAVAAGISINIP